MSSIVTITLNPAIDKSTSVPELLPEKKMRCAAPVFEPGGGGVNVARAIKKLGGEAKAIYLAGGYTGKFFTRLLEKEKVPALVIEIKSHTRENLIVLDHSSNHQYRFGMPGPVIEETEWKKLIKTIEDLDSPGYIVCSGSVPRGVPPGIFAMIAAIAKKKNAKLILDTSGEPLKLALEEGSWLAKPNLGELSYLTGKEWLKPSEAESAAKEIIAKGKAEVMVVSMGEAGAMLITKDDQLMITPPVTEKKSTVGAGDSMVAGIALSLLNGKSLREAVQYGVACGTAATMNPGTELCRLEDAEKLYAVIRAV